MRFSAVSAKASAKREKFEEQGEHIPPFLIASITSACNLHCKGCYSRQNNATSDCAPKDQLSAEEWDRIFTEAEELGISFILLAGGEPLMRRDVLEKAAGHPDIVFPVFTNGVSSARNTLSSSTNTVTSSRCSASKETGRLQTSAGARASMTVRRQIWRN